MATLEEFAARLREANPDNTPMVLRWMAEIFWPGADWLRVTAFRHNGGPRKGELAAAGMAARMARRGLLKRPFDCHGLSSWQWVAPGDIPVKDGAIKPLFIPLKAEYFAAFADGSKGEELRRYGPRWNENTCAVGRDVVLSKGYGKQHRMAGRVWKFKRQHGSLFGSTYKAAILAVFGTLDVEIACISIELLDKDRAEA